MATDKAGDSAKSAAGGTIWAIEDMQLGLSSAEGKISVQKPGDAIVDIDAEISEPDEEGAAGTIEGIPIGTQSDVSSAGLNLRKMSGKKMGKTVIDASSKVTKGVVDVTIGTLGGASKGIQSGVSAVGRKISMKKLGDTVTDTAVHTAQAVIEGTVGAIEGAAKGIQSGFDGRK